MLKIEPRNYLRQLVPIIIVDAGLFEKSVRQKQSAISNHCGIRGNLGEHDTCATAGEVSYRVLENSVPYPGAAGPWCNKYRVDCARAQCSADESINAKADDFPIPLGDTYAMLAFRLPDRCLESLACVGKPWILRTLPLEQSKGAGEVFLARRAHDQTV